jgi:hypothetical protein
MKSIKITTELADEAMLYVDEVLKFLVVQMHLTRFQIRRHYVIGDKNSGLAGYSVPFSIMHNNTYRQVTLHMYKSGVKMYLGQQGKDLVFDALVHELCHLYTTDMREKAMDRHATKKELANADESLTEDFATLLRPFYREEFNKLNTNVCEANKQPSKKVQKQINKLKAKLAK